MNTDREQLGFTGRVQGSTPLDDALAAFCASVAKGDSGRHRGEVERVVGAFAERVQERGADEVQALGVRRLEEYADQLSRRAWAREEDPDAGITEDGEPLLPHGAGAASATSCTTRARS